MIVMVYMTAVMMTVNPVPVLMTDAFANVAVVMPMLRNVMIMMFVMMMSFVCSFTELWNRPRMFVTIPNGIKPFGMCHCWRSDHQCS